MPRPASLTLTVLIILAGLLCLLALTAIWYEVLIHYPENHIGGDVRWIYALALPAAVFSLVLAITGLVPRRFAVFAFSISLALVASLFLLDHFNLLVDSHVWIQRHMLVPWSM